VETSLQASSKEHEHDTKLATTTHYEVFELLHGQDDYDQVENNVDASRHPSVDVQVDAFSMMLAVPMLPSYADRYALQRSCQNECNDVQNAKHYCKVDDASETLLRKNAEVEEQDRYLRQCNRSQIEELGVVKDLLLHICQLELSVVLGSDYIPPELL
jgi:hypothetical protein